MSTPILATKLYIPRPRPKLVHRPRLMDQLNSGVHGKLSLISAPAGFGKTTLVGEWIATWYEPPKPQVAWLSLDAEDNDPKRFLSYMVAAAQTVDPAIGEKLIQQIHSPTLQVNGILTVLLNQLSALPEDFILVLDDYHVIDSKPVDEALVFLLEHMPPQMHLVITTREDPQLPLARMRTRGELTELRAADLRFTYDEAAAFLNQAMDLDLAADDIAALETRTEGWVAGLQLAALAMQGTLSQQGRKDIPEFIQAFAGDNRYVVDYLVEEVLQHQPDHIRRFLLETSILDQLSGPLCDAVRFGSKEKPETPPNLSDAAAVSGAIAVAEPVGSQAILETLERGNLFVVNLDDTRQWYRYHHLFADVLRARLAARSEGADDSLLTPAVTLHERASDWCEQNGLRTESICHAFSAQDFERASNLIELAWPTMDGSFRSNTWLGWAAYLPDELVRARPVLNVAYAWALLNRGELEPAEQRLLEAEQWLDYTGGESGLLDATEPGMVVADEVEFRRLPASIATARAYIAQAVGDATSCVAYAHRALDLLPKDDYVKRGPPASLLALAYWERGDLEAAHQTLADAMKGFLSAGSIAFALSGTYGLADMRIAQGRLHAALEIYEQALRIVEEQGGSPVAGTAELYLGISEIRRMQGDLATAHNYLQRSMDLGQYASLGSWSHRSRIAQASAKESQGELDDALELLEEAKRHYVRTPMPDVRPIDALKARVWIKQGSLAKAQTWAREQSLSADDELSYLREFEHINFARLLIAEYQNTGEDETIHKATDLLERLLKAAQAGERMGSALEILMLHALAYEAQGNTPAALASLERALTIAEPEEYIQPFVDEGPSMAGLLSAAAERDVHPAYARRLLAAFEAEAQKNGDETQRLATALDQTLPEPLTERELEVLRLLRSELSGPEIARQLVVSLNTLRTHTKNIYSKLGVTSRRAAVRRAEELALH